MSGSQLIILLPHQSGVDRNYVDPVRRQRHAAAYGGDSQGMFAFFRPIFGYGALGVFGIVELRARICTFSALLHKHLHAGGTVSPARLSRKICIAEHKPRPAVARFVIVTVNEFRSKILQFFNVVAHIHIVFRNVVS